MTNEAALRDASANLYDEDKESGEVDAVDIDADAAAEDGFELDSELETPSRGGVLLRYNGGNYLAVPTRADIVRAVSAEAEARVNVALNTGAPIYFMPTDVEEATAWAYGAAQYSLRLHGNLLDGSKATVTITDIPVFFDIELANERAEGVGGLAMADAKVSFATEKVFGYPSLRAEPKPIEWLRVSTPTLKERKDAIAAVRAAGLATASDDRSSYYRKASRESNLPLSGWAVLTGYRHSVGPTENAPLSAHLLSVARAGYVPLEDQYDAEKREAGARAVAAEPLLKRARQLVAGWDIETFGPTGDVPIATRPGDEVFMICLTAHWRDDADTLARVCITSIETAPDPARVTVVCNNEENLLRAFAHTLRALAPDVLIGFNDSAYDFPFVVEKLRQYHMLGWFANHISASPRRTCPSDDDALKYNYQAEKYVKINAEEKMLCSYLKMPGCVPIDIRVSFKKLHPKSETTAASSLRFYLGLSKLPNKADLPISRMRRFVKAARAAPSAVTAEQMRQVAHYCEVDAWSCQRLQVRRNVISDNCEVSTLTHVSLADSHYFAGGMKICNILGAYASRRGILMSMIPTKVEETGKYPGAWVFPPEKGLTPDPDRLAAVDAAIAEWRTARQAPVAVRIRVAEAETKEAAPKSLTEAEALLAAAFEAFAPDRPITGLDFASLYPSLMMAYNLSPEKIISTEEERRLWEGLGKELHEISFPYNGRIVHGWSIRHGNKTEEIGLFPTVLIDLFARRAKMKGTLGALGAIKEFIEVMVGRAKKDEISLAEAVRVCLGEAQAEQAETAAPLAPDAPPPRVSPGATVAEELANLKRLNRNAKEKIAIASRLLALGAEAEVKAGDEEIGQYVDAEYGRVCFDHGCLNAKQNALKVTMNTMYGESGNGLSPIFKLLLAGSVTSAGQDNIKRVAEFVQTKGYRIKYGDSVAGNTALILRQDGVIRTGRIDELVPEGCWREYGDKEAAAVPSLEVWQDGGFTFVDRVIRHKHDGPLVRVSTGAGAVDCTADHSLLRPDGAKVRPGELKIGEPLLHADDATLIAELNAGKADTIDDAPVAYRMGQIAAQNNAEGESTHVPVSILYADPRAVRAYLHGFGSELPSAHQLGDKKLFTGLGLLRRRLGAKPSTDARITKMQPVLNTYPHVYDLETRSHHFHVGPGDLVVHNTDSLYLGAPNGYFRECDIDHAEGRTTREEWYAAMVRITMRALNQIRDEVNAFLRTDNGTAYLKMAYEEVLYPADFTGKKKYFGIPHLDEVNFHPKKLFIRGIDVVKQGQPEYAREIGYRIMWRCMDIEDPRPVRRNVEDILRDAIQRPSQWNFDHFIKTAAWKPDKTGNIPVQRFMARMRAKRALEVAEAERARARGLPVPPPLYELPEPGERFSYVLVRTAAAFDLRGLKITPRNGDRMEFARAARGHAEVDVSHYILSYIVGLCARFINGDPEFQTNGATDEVAQRAAKKSLEAFIAGLNAVSPGELRKRGYAYRRAYRAAAGLAQEALIDRVGAAGAEVLQGPWTDFEQFEPPDEQTVADPTSAVVGTLWRSADRLAEEAVRRDSDAWCERANRLRGILPDGGDAATPRSARKLYAAGGPRGDQRVKAAIDRRESEARARLARLVPEVSDIAVAFETELERLVRQFRLGEHATHPEIGRADADDDGERPDGERPDGEEEKPDGEGPEAKVEIFGVTEAHKGRLLEFRRAWFNAAGIQVARRRADAYASFNQQLKNRRLDVAPPLSADARRRAIAEAAARLRPP